MLRWVDELTLIAESHASKDAFDELKAHFSDEEIVWLILAITQINSWNRIAISTRSQFERTQAAQPAHVEKAPEPA